MKWIEDRRKLLGVIQYRRIEEARRLDELQREENELRDELTGLCQ